MIKKWIWPISAIAIILLNKLLSFFPGFVEKIYSEGVFLGIRYIYDYSIGLLPFPFLYLIVFCLFVWLIFSLRKMRKRSFKLKVLILAFFRSGLNFISIVIILFYVLWGFNYLRPTIKDKLELEIVELDLEQLKSETIRISEILIASRSHFGIDSLPLGKENLAEDYEKRLRLAVKSTLKSMGYSTGGRVRGRIIKPKGILMRFSTAGIYIPHAFEGHVDGGMHPIQWPSAIAHEMTHAYGFTNEGECNFIAFLATKESEDKFIRYSGYLSYWRYLISSLRRADKKAFNEIWASIPGSIKADLKEIRLYQDKYPDLIPKIRNAIYGRYLRSHGVKEGLLSYSQVVLLVDAWNRKNKNK